MLYIQDQGPYGRRRGRSRGLRAGDVVNFRFPMRAHPSEDALRPRPCLVLEIVELAGGAPYAVLAYGAAIQGRKTAFDVDVSEPLELLIAGCRRPHRFFGGLPLMISLDSPDLPSRTTKPGWLGALTGTALRRLGRVNIERSRRAAASEKHRARRRMKLASLEASKQPIDPHHLSPTPPHRR